MELTDVQKKSIEVWVREGCSLSEIQQRLSSEYGLSMTYMDVRFILIDMGLQIKEKLRNVTPVHDVSSASLPVEEHEAGGRHRTASAVPGTGKNVVVSVDRITVPGAVVSGSVVFSDGVKATWFVDQMGRLALNPSKPGYAPPQSDIPVFQTELRNALAKCGY